MYRINLFSKMVGLSPSKIRFYEKYGLLKVKETVTVTGILRTMMHSGLMPFVF